MDDPFLRRQIVERAFVRKADELFAAHRLRELALAGEVPHQPAAVGAQHVLGVWLYGRSHVRRQRPRRRRPDDQRLAFALLEGEADVERWVLELPVVLVAGLLMVRE
jgi:hypothetical protein